MKLYQKNKDGPKEIQVKADAHTTWKSLSLLSHLSTNCIVTHLVFFFFFFFSSYSKYQHKSVATHSKSIDDKIRSREYPVRVYTGEQHTQKKKKKTVHKE